MQLTLITGNTHKLEEWQRMMPADIKLDHHPLDLDEIQSLDSAEIIRHKVRQAYEAIGQPVVVEDVSCGLDKLNGLPGPFIKFFEKQLGNGALYKLAGGEALATAICTIGYFDGKHEYFAVGEVRGKVVAPRTASGFGFDTVFIPDGVGKTYAEMTGPEKDAVSHRRLAIDELLKQLGQL